MLYFCRSRAVVEVNLGASAYQLGATYRSSARVPEWQTSKRYKLALGGFLAVVSSTAAPPSPSHEAHLADPKATTHLETMVVKTQDTGA